MSAEDRKCNICNEIPASELADGLTRGMLVEKLEDMASNMLFSLFDRPDEDRKSPEVAAFLGATVNRQVRLMLVLEVPDAEG